MAAPRLISSLVLRATRSQPAHTARHIRALPNALFSHRTCILPHQHPRLYSTPSSSPSKIYNYDSVSALSSNPTPSTILIDTREPAELQTTGTIPNSVNIPITSQPDSFFITPEEFEDRFGFERPAKDTEVVFYCKAGVRSRAAAELAKQAGWKSVGEYQGSWLDWERNGGKKEGGREGP